MDTTVMAWLVSGLCVLFNLAVTTTLTILIKRWFDRRDTQAKKTEKEREELKAMREAEKDRQMQDLMDARCNAQICAIHNEMESVSNQLIVINASICAGLRDDLLNSYWRCHDWQKFRSGWDTENMEDLYKAYKKMGGNSFIDHLMDEFYKIPLQ